MEGEGDIHKERAHTILEGLRYFLRFNQPIEALRKLFEFVNSVPGSKYTYPATSYEIMKFISSDIEMKYHVICLPCQQYTEIKDTRSETPCLCGKIIKCNKNNFFVTLGVENQIKKTLIRHWNSIKNYCEEINGQLVSSDSKDVYSGSILKNLYSKSSSFLLPLSVNTDGAKIFKTDSKSLWLLLLSQNYLPPEIRYLQENIILAGMYYGPHKPDMQKFFEPLISEFESFEMNKMDFTVNGVMRTFEPVITMCTVDLPAKSEVQQIKQYNGKSSCTYCKHPGIKIPNTSFNLYRYGKVDPPPLPRTNIETLKTMQAIMESKLSTPTADGIKGVSCLTSLYGFDIIKGFGIDYMHCILLGVMKKLLSFWIDSSHSEEPFYIAPDQKEILNKKILSITPTSVIKRLPRSIYCHSTLKANELRALLLYYLPVCLPGHFKSNVYYKHFMKLSSSIYILLSTTISAEQLNTAEKALIEFVEEFEQHYKARNIVMNVHLVKHIIDSVRCHGPLWTHSAFCFESFNGVMTKYVNGRTDVLLQISSKYLMNNTLRTDKKTTDDESYLMGKGKLLELTSEDETVLRKAGFIEDNCNSLMVYARYFNGHKIYTSTLYTRCKTRTDYFVELKNQAFGIVKYYFTFKNRQYALFQLHKIVENRSQALGVEKDTTIIISASHIIHKYIYMKKTHRYWIVAEPNRFERD